MTPATRRRSVLIGTVLGLWLAAAVWKSLGRPHLAHDLPLSLRVLADSFPSLIGGLTVPLGFLAAHPDPRASDVRRACLWAVPLLILAEVVELAFRTSRFDWYDLILSLVGVAITGWAAARALRRPSTGQPSDQAHAV